MCGVNESLLSRSMPRVLMESEVPTVVPATLTAATGSVNRALWAVLKWIASDLFVCRTKCEDQTDSPPAEGQTENFQEQQIAVCRQHIADVRCPNY